MKYSGIGGQAVMEGVMMQNKDTYAVAVRKPDHEIDVKVSKRKNSKTLDAVRKIPILRGAARFAYNWALAKEKDNYEKGGKFISDSELRKEFTRLRNSAEYAWLQNVSNNVTKQAIKDACIAYKNFFKSLQKHQREKVEPYNTLSD